jgi:GMP reductase
MLHLYDSNPGLDFKDVLIVPRLAERDQKVKPRSRREVNLVRTFEMAHARNNAGGNVLVTGVPLIAANMDTVATVGMARALAGHDMFTAVHKHYKTGQMKRANLSGAHTFITFGMTDIGFINDVLGALPQVNKVCLDIANGYLDGYQKFISEVRRHHPDKAILAGNVATPEGTLALLEAGADIVKIGIGPGSACDTRMKTGVGYPQLSAIAESAEQAHNYKSTIGPSGLICADGGCKVPGDVAKAFAAGADFVMLGGMLAGHRETLTPAEYKKAARTGKVEYHGMSSERAMKKHHGGVAKHRASEGRVVTTDYKGLVADTVQDIKGGLNSACTYVNTTELADLPKRAAFKLIR